MIYRICILIGVTNLLFRTYSGVVQLVFIAAIYILRIIVLFFIYIIPCSFKVFYLPIFLLTCYTGIASALIYNCHVTSNWNYLLVSMLSSGHGITQYSSTHGILLTWACFLLNQVVI